ncbi:cytochrome b [Alginatibacterium sediminis]|uniref:Cytochrome b n=1 Tax=Alginatibacterium sediminis TaxID=2164068 RepID=A0A420ECQ0_9ALTE|nr:cytochrome b [Alginatibacterium sediminis]RKF18477.1 cytochrome b [Alginatibacterium sediminis]
MRLGNSESRYGLISQLFHWVFAITIIALFALGTYMVDLTYYDSWYQSAPWWHKSFGAILLLLVLPRFIWKALSVRVKPLASDPPLQQKAAHAAHMLLLLLLVTVLISGYLISTADGRSIEVFAWFSLPASVTGLPDQATRAGLVHEYAALALVILAGLHGLAALKHHFINKDKTLLRMLPGKD